jgi:cytochrome c oxidase subunit I
MTGCRYSRTLGYLHFWLTFVGANLTFFPMHFLGLAGMPRRIPDYPEMYSSFNTVSTVGSVTSVSGVLLFAFIIVHSIYLNDTYYENNNIE